MTLTTSFQKLAWAYQGVVFHILNLFFQFVQLYKFLLAWISVAYIKKHAERYEKYESYILSQKFARKEFAKQETCKVFLILLFGAFLLLCPGGAFASGACSFLLHIPFAVFFWFAGHIVCVVLFCYSFSATRNFALRLRGFAAISSADGTMTLLLTARKGTMRFP